MDLLVAVYLGAGIGTGLTIALRLTDGRTARERLVPAWMVRDDWATVLAAILWPFWWWFIVRQRIRRDRARRALNGD